MSVVVVTGAASGMGRACVGRLRGLGDVLRAAARAPLVRGPLGGRVCSVSPGTVDTPMGRQELEQQPVRQQMLARTPLGRTGRPEEVAEVVAPCCRSRRPA